MRELKTDLFGTVWRGEERGGEFVLRAIPAARAGGRPGSHAVFAA
jgi:hypothetical protein